MRRITLTVLLLFSLVTLTACGDTMGDRALTPICR